MITTRFGVVFEPREVLADGRIEGILNLPSGKQVGTRSVDDLIATGGYLELQEALKNVKGASEAQFGC